MEGRDLNREVRKVQCIHPNYPPENNGYSCAVIDSSALLSSQGQALLDTMEGRTVFYITRGVHGEIIKAQGYGGSRRATEKEREDALTLVERLQKAGRILDVKTRGSSGHSLLEFENYDVLYPLSRGLSKAVLQELVLENFRDFYENLAVLYGGYRRRNRRGYFHDIERSIIAGTDDGRSEPEIQDAYRRLHELLKNMNQKLPSEIEKTLKRIGQEIHGTLDSNKYKEITASRGRSNIPDTQYFFEKLIRFILHRIEEGKPDDETKSAYEKEKGNKNSTDRKVVLAAYAFIPNRHPQAQKIGIVTRDRDQSELLRLRRVSTIDYSRREFGAAK